MFKITVLCALLKSLFVISLTFVQSQATTSTQEDNFLRTAYQAYSARFNDLSFEEFSGIYVNNAYLGDPSWYPGANCDNNGFTYDYCGDPPGSYFGVYTDQELEWVLQTDFISSCPGLMNSYHSIKAERPSLNLSLFLEAVFNAAPVEPLLGDTQAIVKASCEPLIANYERQQLLGSRLGLAGFVLNELIYQLQIYFP